MYAHNFEGRRYCVENKLEFLDATVEYALRKPEIKDNFVKYLKRFLKEN